MRHTATLTYSRPLLKKAALAFWRRSIGLEFPVVLVVVAGVALFMAANGRRTWEMGVLLTVALFGFLFLSALYVVHYRNGLAKLHDMGSPVAEFVAETDSFTVRSGMGSSSLRWSSISEVWKFDGFWLLLFSKAQFMTIPLQTVPPEM
jgi:hypothetical protein